MSNNINNTDAAEAVRSGRNEFRRLLFQGNSSQADGQNSHGPLVFQEACRLREPYTLIDCSASFLLENPFWPDMPLIPLWRYRLAWKALVTSIHCYNVLTDEVTALATFRSQVFPLPPRACGSVILVLYMNRSALFRLECLRVLQITDRKTACFIVKEMPPRSYNFPAVHFPECSSVDRRFHVFRYYSMEVNVLEMHHFETVDGAILKWTGCTRFEMGEGNLANKVVYFEMDQLVFSAKSAESDEIEATVVFRFRDGQFMNGNANFSTGTMLHWVASNWRGGTPINESIVFKNCVYSLQYTSGEAYSSLLRASLGVMSLKLLAFRALACLDIENKRGKLSSLGPYAQKCSQYI